MKKVNLLKLNIHQENILSKEEKKKILGGRGRSACYVTCGPYGPPTTGVPSCEPWAITNVCGSSGLSDLGYCICNG